MSEVNITSHNQKSGITAHTVSVNQPPPPPPPLPLPPSTPWWRSWWAAISGIILVLAAVVAILEYFGISPWEKKHMPDSTKVTITSINQQGGITAHTVNIGPQPRSLSAAPALQAEILQRVPRDKPITVLALMGDSESYRFAAEIHAFLKANSFKLTEDGISQGMFTPPPRGLSLDDRGDHLDFIVGSAQ